MNSMKLQILNTEPFWELDRGARENRKQESVGILPVEVAEAALLGIKEDQLEIVIGLASNLRSAPEKIDLLHKSRFKK